MAVVGPLDGGLFFFERRQALLGAVLNQLACSFALLLFLE
jgi:hypothetical protein